MSFKHIVFFFFLALLTMSASPVMAGQSTGDLTQEKVKDFIKETVKITSGRQKEMSAEDIEEYLDIHLDDNAHFKSTMKYIIPGYDVQESELSLAKEDYIKSIKEADQALAEHETKVKVKNVKISKDKRKATVVTETKEKGEMPIEGQIIPIIGSSSCKQILRLNNNDIIQMYSAICETQIEFENSF